MALAKTEPLADLIGAALCDAVRRWFGIAVQPPLTCPAPSKQGMWGTP
jgi:hypothetical protein